MSKSQITFDLLVILLETPNNGHVLLGKAIIFYKNIPLNSQIP